MDCRKTLGLGLCFLMGVAGCSHNVAVGPSLLPAESESKFTSLHPQSKPENVQVLPPGAMVRREADLSPRMPRASTCVAFGDWAAAEANAPDLSDSLRQVKREKARKAYQQALNIDAHYMPAYESLASLYGDLKDHSHAVATYLKAAQIFPNESRIFYELGQCYGSAQEWQPALQALGRAVQLDPENRQYVDALGWMQARVGLYDESMATFLKVHDSAEAHYRLALMLEHLQQTELCKQHLRAALQKDPNQDRAKALLAQLTGAPTEPIQPVVFTQRATARLTDVSPAPEESADPPKPAPRARVVILPPPPQILIQYDDAAAPPDER